MSAICLGLNKRMYVYLYRRSFMGFLLGGSQVLAVK